MLQPSTMVPLRLVPNTSGKTEETRRRYKIDLSVFPRDRGVYRIRFANRQVGRLVGATSCIRVGSADGGFYSRFAAYNNQMAVTVGRPDLPALLSRERQQNTNALLMHYLAYGCREEEIAVDLFFTEEPLKVEKELLHDFIRQHYELPPLNFGRR